MHFSTASEWLSWIASIHPAEIDLGLDRVKQVAERLGVLRPSSVVITVGGTNGKGSTVAALEAIYRTAHYQVGVFTSPYLFKHNEQIKINGVEATDEEFCAAFSKIESAREEVSLTPFEYHTLAALLLFANKTLDVILLEVGLGGRLDAVNIMDADLAIVTSIGIDHVEWLGETREEIGFEKAGIFRKGSPAVCGDNNPPATLINYAKKLGTPLYIQDKDFSFTQSRPSEWSWEYKNKNFDHLPRNALAIQNMSTVMMAVTLLQDKLSVKEEAIAKGLTAVNLPGRIQIVPGAVMQIFDVAHNPHAVALLANHLKANPGGGKTRAVFSILADKDMLMSIREIATLIDEWYVAPLPIKRGASKEKLEWVFKKASIANYTCYPTIEEAYKMAMSNSGAGDKVIIFGSFHTVAAILGSDEYKKSE